jgi:methionine sulfoxide reductase heme-binding subunit
MPDLSLGLFLAAAPGVATGTNTTWLIARDLGLVTYLLATSSVLVGLATSTRTGDRTVGRGAVYDSHRALALLTLTALSGHILFLALDSYAQFSITSLFVPFTIWYRPVWSSLGIVAAYLLVAVYASFYVRSLIGYRTWRALHYATFGVFVLATLHGFMAGSDAHASWSIMLYVGAVGSVAVMLTYRLLRGVSVAPRWAWLDSVGDEGAARIAFSMATVMGAVVLTGVVLLTAGTPATTAASDDNATVQNPAASVPSSQSDPANPPNANEPQYQRRSGNVVFSGTVESDGWRLQSPSLRGVELDVTNSGHPTLIQLNTGETIFQSSSIVSVVGTSGSFQTTLNGVGQYAGGRVIIDGNYQVAADQVSLAAQVEVDTPVTR